MTDQNQRNIRDQNIELTPYNTPQYVITNYPAQFNN